MIFFFFLYKPVTTRWQCCYSSFRSRNVLANTDLSNLNLIGLMIIFVCVWGIVPLGINIWHAVSFPEGLLLIKSQHVSSSQLCYFIVIDSVCLCSSDVCLLSTVMHLDATLLLKANRNDVSSQKLKKKVFSCVTEKNLRLLMEKKG